MEHDRVGRERKLRGEAREGARRWQADSGQYLLAFEGSPADGSLSVMQRAAPQSATPAEDVDAHINRLRRVLAGSGHERLIQTVAGVGYRFSS